MNTKTTFNRQYLLRKSVFLAISIGIGMFIAKFDLDTDFQWENFIKRLISSLIAIAVTSVVLYWFYIIFYLRRAEKITFQPNNSEEIVEEKLVSFAKNWFSITHGKLFKTSERMVFKSLKGNQIEIPLTEITSEMVKNTSFYNHIEIISKENKKYRFEIFS